VPALPGAACGYSLQCSGRCSGQLALAAASCGPAAVWGCHTEAHAVACQGHTPIHGARACCSCRAIGGSDRINGSADQHGGRAFTTHDLLTSRLLLDATADTAAAWVSHLCCTPNGLCSVAGAAAPTQGQAADRLLSLLVFRVQDSV
jgi:hypothetical protein